MPMKNRVIFFFLVSIAIWFVAREQAVAAAFTMGQFQTVASDGALDVLRNPSLLTAQVQNNAIGVMFLAAPYTDQRFSYNAFWGGTYYEPDFYEEKRLAGSMYLSYSGKTPHGTVGIAIDAGNPYQALYLKFQRNYYGYNTSFPFTQTVDGDGESLTLSPRLVFSYGIVVSGSHSLGVQWALGYSRNREETTFTVLNNASLAGYHWATKTVDDVNAELSMGYSYRTESSQAGLMLRSGRFNWEKTNINYGHNDLVNSIFYSGSVSEPFYFLYDRGFSILAGGYHKLAPFIAIALEGEYEIPFHYNYKAVRYDESTGFYGYTKNITVNKSGFYAIRAGFEILPAGPVTVNLGGEVSTTIVRANTKNSNESAKTDTYGGTLGLDIRVIDSILIMVGSRLVYTHMRTERYSDQEYLGSFAVDGLTRTLKVDLFLGLSGGF